MFVMIIITERTFGRAGPRAEGDLALRSQVATKPALSYIDVFVKALGDLWAPANPKGYIVLLIAENKLTTEVLSKRMKKVTSVGNEVFCYDSFRGTLAFRSAVASYATTTFAKGCEMDPEHLAIWVDENVGLVAHLIVTISTATSRLASQSEIKDLADASSLYGIKASKAPY